MLRILRKLMEDRAALLGLLLILLLVLAAVLAPLLSTHPGDVTEFHTAQRLSPPGAENWLGTDRMGSDIYSRLLFGARITITIAVTAIVVAVLIGVPIGLVNVSKNGGLGPVAWWSSLTAANAGVRFRSGRFYSIIAAGGVNREVDDGIGKSVAAQFFYGFRIPLERWFFDCDAGFSHLDNEPLYSESASNDQMAIQGRVSAGISFAGGFSVFAGGGTVYLWDYGKIDEGGYRPLFLAGAAFEF